jgi:hypothetical protein
VTADRSASRTGSSRIALMIALCVAAGLALGLGAAVLHRQGQSLPFWDARTPAQKWHDAWVAEVGALSWPSKPPPVGRYNPEIDGDDGTEEARTLVDTAWECGWVPIWLNALGGNPKRAVDILASMSGASLGTTSVDLVLHAMRGDHVGSVRQFLSADC